MLPAYLFTQTVARLFEKRKQTFSFCRCWNI